MRLSQEVIKKTPLLIGYGNIMDGDLNWYMYWQNNSTKYNLKSQLLISFLKGSVILFYLNLTQYISIINPLSSVAVITYIYMYYQISDYIFVIFYLGYPACYYESLYNV